METKEYVLVSAEIAEDNSKLAEEAARVVCDPDHFTYTMKVNA